MDIDRLFASTLTAKAFRFQISPTGTFDQTHHPVETRSTAPASTSISVQPGSPTRVVLAWPDNTIVNRWLRITVLANGNTGLSEPATFYLGHLLGKTSPTQAEFYQDNSDDLTSIRNAVGQAVSSGSTWDINKNGVVSFADIAAMRAALDATLTNITVPHRPASAELNFSQGRQAEDERLLAALIVEIAAASLPETLNRLSGREFVCRLNTVDVAIAEIDWRSQAKRPHAETSTSIDISLQAAAQAFDNPRPVGPVKPSAEPMNDIDFQFNLRDTIRRAWAKHVR